MFLIGYHGACQNRESESTTKWGISAHVTFGIRKPIENSRDEMDSVCFHQHEKGQNQASSVLDRA